MAKAPSLRVKQLSRQAALRLAVAEAGHDAERLRTFLQCAAVNADQPEDLRSLAAVLVRAADLWEHGN